MSSRMRSGSRPVPHLSWAAVLARRLERHGLAASSPHTHPADVAAAICGAHAQVMSAAELSIAQRLPDATRVDVRRALWEERSLVKTRGPRGTVHLLPTRDLPLWTGALAATPPPAYLQGRDALMTPEEVEQVIGAIGAALADAELTQEELTEQIVARVGSWAGDPVMEAFQSAWPRWVQAMDPATRRGVLCFGLPRGRKVTYTNPHRWLPGFRPAEAETSLAWFAASYLHAYGPATPQHLARWLNVPPAWAMDLFTRLADQDRLHPVDLDGLPAWVPAGDTTLPDSPPRGVRLLGYFDAYAVGSHPREWVFPGRAAERALAGGQAGNYPVVLLDGLVGGVWHQRRSGRTIHLTVEPVVDLTPGQLADLDEQAQQVGEILEGTPKLQLGKVTVGPHA